MEELEFTYRKPGRTWYFMESFTKDGWVQDFKYNSDNLKHISGRAKFKFKWAGPLGNNTVEAVRVYSVSRDGKKTTHLFLE